MKVKVERKIFGKRLSEVTEGSLFIFAPSPEAPIGVYMKAYPEPYLKQISSCYVPVIKIFDERENSTVRGSQRGCGSLTEFDGDVRVLEVIFEVFPVLKIKE